MTLLVEIVGWVGAVFLLLAYGLVSSGKVESSASGYQLMNIVGALGFVVNSGWNGAYPSAAVNVIWMAIGIVALMSSRRRRD